MMELYSTLALFAVGFFILIRGANILVRGATSIATMLRMSGWLIGAVILGIGTSIPELSISIASVFNGNAIGLETIIGSNTFNILFILGLLAIITPLSMKKEWVHRDFMLNIGAVFIAGAVILFPFFGGASFGGVDHMEGALLLGLFAFWLVFMFRGREESTGSVDHKVFTVATSLFMISIGLVGVFFGGQWVVNGAKEIAAAIDISSALVALTIVAAGTSFPELTVSLVAMWHKRADVAVGNIVGSSIFDFLGIIGITALIRPIPVQESLQFDIGAALGASLLLLVAVYVGRRYILARPEGVFFIATYCMYLALIIMRG
jgi:cation:H+ antiporter